MQPVLIDNGKNPDEPLNARLLFWLPTDSPYGNFQLKLMKLFQHLDEANRRIIEAFKCWNQARTQGMTPINAYERHIYAVDQAIFLMRRTADELIALIWCLSKWEMTKLYPKQIKIDCIGASFESDCLPEVFKKHAPLMSELNEIANASKHSFVQTDMNLIGRDEPCIFALELKYNKLSSGTKFHAISLNRLINEFSAFFKTGIEWLRAFSERNRPRGGPHCLKT